MPTWPPAASFPPRPRSVIAPDPLERICASVSDKPVKLPVVAVACRFASITTAPFTVSIDEPDWNAILREARNVAAPLPANSRFVFASTTMSSTPGDAASFTRSMSSDRPEPSVMSLSSRTVSSPSPPLIIQLPVYATLTLETTIESFPEPPSIAQLPVNAELMPPTAIESLPEPPLSVQSPVNAGSELAIVIVSFPAPESTVIDVDGFANRTTGVETDETNSICRPSLSAISRSVTVSSPICDANTRAVASKLSITAVDTDTVMSEAAAPPEPSGSSAI